MDEEPMMVCHVISSSVTALWRSHGPVSGVAARLCSEPSGSSGGQWRPLDAPRVAWRPSAVPSATLHPTVSGSSDLLHPSVSGSSDQRHPSVSGSSDPLHYSVIARPFA